MNENQKPAKDVSRWNLSVIRLISGRTNLHQERLWLKSLTSKTALEKSAPQVRLCLSGMGTKHVHHTIKHKYFLCSERKDSHSWNMQNDLVSAFVSGYPQPLPHQLSSLNRSDASCLLSLTSRTPLGILVQHIITPRGSSHRCYHSIVCTSQASTHK